MVFQVHRRSSADIFQNNIQNTFNFKAVGIQWNKATTFRIRFKYLADSGDKIHHHLIINRLVLLSLQLHQIQRGLA